MDTIGSSRRASPGDDRLDERSQGSGRDPPPGPGFPRRCPARHRCQSRHKRQPSGRVSASSTSRMPVRSQCRRHQAAECRHHRLGSHHPRRWSGTGPSISRTSPAPAIPNGRPASRSERGSSDTGHPSRIRRTSRCTQWRRRTPGRTAATVRPHGWGRHHPRRRHPGCAEGSPRR